MRAKPGKSLVVVLEPTRELARWAFNCFVHYLYFFSQVAQEIEKLTPKLNIALVYGGAGMEPQVFKCLDISLSCDFSCRPLS